MRNFIFSGKLGSDARIQTTIDNKNFIAFSVAEGSRERTTWIDCTKNFSKECPEIFKYLKKGVSVVINGIPYAQLSKDSNGTTVARLKVIVTDIELTSYPQNK